MYDSEEQADREVDRLADADKGSRKMYSAAETNKRAASGANFWTVIEYDNETGIERVLLEKERA